MATFRFKSLTSEKTHVEMTFEFTPKMGLLGMLMVPIMKLQIKKMLRGLLEGNAQFVTQRKLAEAANGFKRRERDDETHSL